MTWRNGDTALVTTTEIVNGVTAGTVTGTTQQDGHYDVHLVDDHGVRATYSNRELKRPENNGAYRPHSI